MIPFRARFFPPTLAVVAFAAASRMTAIDPEPAPAPAMVDGTIAAATYCTQCHLLPDPSLLDRKTWRDELMPRMRVLTGLDKPSAEAGFHDVPTLLALHAFPEKPVVPEAAFNAAFEHFIALAPETTVSRQKQDEIKVGLKNFRTTIVPDRHSPPLTSFVRIDPRRHEILLGDANFQGFNVLDADLHVTEGVKLGNIPVGVALTPNAEWFACIGHFFPREEPHGQIIRLSRSEPDKYQRTVVVDDLPRTTDIQLADLNGDGRIDFTACIFGNFVGRFSWFENLGEDKFKEHVLFDKPGAIRCEVADYDKDGKPDLVVVVAQATEAMLVFQGDGKGNFERHTLYQRPPSWGHSGFQLADFNGDGRPDLLVTNGDNADFTTSPPRAHHGVRIFLNRPDWKVEEVWFGPMNGAYKAVARDFDGDGDLDIAAISFFPDYTSSPRESFIHFENVGVKGEYNFVMSTFRECASGRWLTMDCGDLDGDGHDDLVLGSMIKMPAKVPDFLMKEWEKAGPSIVVLRNTTK